MAGENRRTRRSDRYAATPERVNQAAERMQADAGNRGWNAAGAAPQSYPGQNYPPQSCGAQGSAGPGGQNYPQQGYEDPRAAEEYARQQAMMQQYAYQQEYARQQQEYARQQQEYARQQREKQRVASETSSRGVLRGYTGMNENLNQESGGGNGGGNGGGRDGRKSGGRRKPGAAPIILLSLLALAILAGGILGISSHMRNKELEETVRAWDNVFCDGVYVDGIALSGMTPEQALASVQSQIRQRQEAWKVRLSYNGATVAEINSAMLGMSVDVGQVMNEAWAKGHTPAEDYQARLEEMQALRETPYEAYTAVPSGDTAVIDNVLAELKTRIDKPAVDAELVSFDTTQPYPFIFKQEETGLSLDTTEIREELYRMVSTMTGGSVELVPDTVQPGVTVNDLQKHYMLRSSVYTPISTSSTEERNNNIRRAFEFVNGYVLQPGAKFSFNTVVGERTEENGFFPAIEYAYGEHVMGVGGGVCQASTTVYQAAVCAGLQIVNRKPHSDAVSYTEYGKDATVYLGSRRKIDLVFKNNSEEPIYMVAGVQTDPSNKRRLIAKVSMYGADMGSIRYEMEAEVIEEIEPPEEPVYVKDKQAAYVTYTDQQESVSKAQKGYVVNSYRVEYVGNVVNERKLLYTDTYDAKPERIYVGVTKRPEE